MRNLVIVESPSKIKKLSDFLGSDYKIVSSLGHVRDLPKSDLGVDVEDNFSPLYVSSPDKKDVIRGLKKDAKLSSAIYLATDLDREGEAIAWHVAHLINGDNDLKEDDKAKDYQIAHKIRGGGGSHPKVYRVTFNSITKGDVLDAFDHPRKLNMSLVDAQQARRVLDRLVGYKLSPLLWEKIRYGLSAGRVQSVAVRFVVEREREIENFDKSKFFEITCEFSRDDVKRGRSSRGSTSIEAIEAQLTKIDTQPIYIKEKHALFAGEYTSTSTTIKSAKDAKNIETDLKTSTFKIANVDKKETKRHPSPPFTTSTLQQAAASNLSYTPKKTMQLAQKLYEAGLITYMRTDSVSINSTFVKSIREYVNKQFGKKYLFMSERYFKSKKGAKTQEAHEAIRPTSIRKNAEKLPKSVPRGQRKLYDLIYRRTVATQMSPAVYANTKIVIEGEDKGKSKDISKGTKYTLEASGSTMIFDGFQKVYYTKNKDQILPSVKSKEKVNLKKVNIEGKEITSPPRYNEASLVRELEKFGIGRPSTYASIIDTIQKRGYVSKIEKVLYPTDNGIVVNDLLTAHFPQIVDVDFTAEMEEGLDEVAAGELDWHKLIKDFYEPFDKLLKIKKKEIKKEDVVVLEKTDEVCPECKKNKLVVKLGKYGKFLSCSGFPVCQYARPIEETAEAQKAKQAKYADEQAEIDKKQEKCPECGGRLVIKVGRFGKFIACDNYPKCKYTRKIDNKVGMKCPECGEKYGGEVVYKRTRKGRTFYGCSRYPDCKFASWTKPGEEKKKK